MTETERSPATTSALRTLLVAVLLSTAAFLGASHPSLAQPEDPPAAPEGEPAITIARASLPNARADSYTVSQDNIRHVKAPGVLKNDSNRPLIARFVLGAEYGDVGLGKRGGFTYDPDENFRGTDYFKYRACDKARPSRCSKAVAVKLTVSGAAPNARANWFQTRRNQAKKIAAPGVLKNDADANGDALRVISYAQPRRGGVVVGSGGYLRFVPDRNFTGKTSFRYWIGDGTGLRDSALATFRVRR